MKEQSLFTIEDLNNNNNNPIYFGNSPVVSKAIGEDGEHKSARKEQRKLMTTLSSCFEVDVLDDYLYHQNSGAIFIKTVFPQSEYFIGLRAGNQNSPPDPNLPIHFVSGICIGSSSTITGVGESGQTYDLLENTMPSTIAEPIKAIEYRPKLTVYEADTITKLTGLIEALTKTRKNHKSVTISFHLPDPEYALYGLQYYANGIFGKAMLFDFVTMIASKSKELKKMLTKRFQKITPGNNFNIGSPLESLINSQFLMSSDFDLEQILNQLAHFDPLWKNIISHNQPISWVDLAYCSYSYLYLKLSQISNDNLIGVENPEETTILSESKKIASNQGLPLTITCLYPHSQVFTTTGHPKRLFRHQSTNVLEDLLTVARQY